VVFQAVFAFNRVGMKKNPSPQSQNGRFSPFFDEVPASEIDFDSALVGGPARLIDTILHTPKLDAWPVTADDSLAYNADEINQVAPGTPSSRYCIHGHRRPRSGDRRIQRPELVTKLDIRGIIA
jgi:hypothetical protein